MNSLCGRGNSSVLTKLALGPNAVKCDIQKVKGRFVLKFGWNRAIKDHVKRLSGAKWDPDVKAWSISINAHNLFQLSFLMGQDVYARWEKEEANLVFERPLMEHQKLLVNQAVIKKQHLWAAEMGTGKTLCMIELMERIPITWWYIGPKSACISVRRELTKWGSKAKVVMLTYEDLVKALKVKQPAPEGIIFDESSRIKTPTAQRSKAAMHVTEAMRAEHKEHYIICATGSPATKNPLDWWHQIEVLQPGFLVEGDLSKLRSRLCVYKEDSDASYPIVLGWRDSEERCDVCGKMRDEHVGKAKDGHLFKPCINEVAKLGRRMKDIVTVIFKKDCLELPDLRRVLFKAKPTRELMLTSQKVFKSTTTAIEGLTKLRQLSDGFLYSDEEGDEITCPACSGSGELITFGLKEGWKHEDCCHIDPSGRSYPDGDGAGITVKVDTCYHCNGTGKARTRGVSKVASPKIDMLKTLLERYEEAGRVVIYAGFQASVDTVEQVCKKAGWLVFKADGRGWIGEDEWLTAMDRGHPSFLDLKVKYPKLAFIGHPKTSGMGLTLTSSPVVIYYSNDFNADDRVQSEARIHRAGMDTNTCPTIIDLCVLDTDIYVLKNLMLKRTLQGITLGQVAEELDHLQIDNVEVENYDG